MPEYIPTIGLEVHAELRTQTKMFCNSANDPNKKRPNVNICPVCIAHPGTLPVINKEAVKHVLKVGVAFGSTLADFTEFDRKNYFYPDIPKGYQISQYKFPLVTGGSLNGIALTRVHLEEDTARSIHVDNRGFDTLIDADNDIIRNNLRHNPQRSASLLDFNRAGVPLMELVTEPVIHDAKTASNFARELQLVLRYLGASEANMEKGEMRIEANVSVCLAEQSGTNAEQRGKLGTKVEVKNLNSFRSVERAIEYEIQRQIETLNRGDKIVQETRGWDEGKQQTYSQRLKESSHDYRYFPDPDLPKLKLSEIPEFHTDELKKTMPELPWEKRARFNRDYGIKAEDIESYVTDISLGKFFEEAIRNLGCDKEKIKIVSNYITSDLVGLTKKAVGDGIFAGVVLDDVPIIPEEVGELVLMIDQGLLNSRGAKDTLAILFSDGGDAREVAEKNGFLQKSDSRELVTMVEKIIGANGKVVAEYKAGKTAGLQFLIGQAMKETKGSANPGVLKKLFEEKLQ